MCLNSFIFIIMPSNSSQALSIEGTLACTFSNEHYLSFINSLGMEFIAFLVYNGYDHVEHNIISIKTGKILAEVLSFKI